MIVEYINIFSIYFVLTVHGSCPRTLQEGMVEKRFEGHAFARVSSEQPNEQATQLGTCACWHSETYQLHLLAILIPDIMLQLLEREYLSVDEGYDRR